tara:strand:- start:232139 stop:234343 length:2205 start_codon:yes stop_codon:yes gene_type:complete
MKRLLPFAISVFLIFGIHARGLPAAELVKQGDRIGWSADGNLVDPDDWGATAMALAIFAKQGWQDKLVHLDYNNRLDRNNPIKAAEETVSVVEGVKKFKFKTTKLYDCQNELEAAIENATAEINKSSRDSRFWYVQAGPFEVAYQALRRADPAKRQFCILVSHSEVNERSGKWKDAHGKDECVELGATYYFTEKQGKEKFGSGSFRKWHLVDWMKNSPCPEYRWVHSRMRKTAEHKDGVLDASDGGMAYVLATGDTEGNFSPKLENFLGSGWNGGIPNRPNIVLILADDLGYGSLNSYGADKTHIRTPNIDRLATEGRRFTDANTPSSVCSPTRYGLLTGRYDWRTDLKHGVINTTDPLHIETSRPTIASLLKSVGYRTAAIGKWHLGYGTEKHDFTEPLSPGPLDLGFDYHFAVPQNHGDASGVYVRNREVVGLRSDRRVPAGKSPYGRDFMGIDAPQRIDENVMDELTSDATRWLEKQTDDSPFFLYFAPVAIHFPYTPSNETKGKSGTGLYGDWIHELDLSVGRILDTLDRMKVTDETLVVFTSDNGGVLIADGDRPEAVAYRAGLRCNGTLRGRKHSIYQGGFRVPFIARWPGHIQAQSVCDETISLVDMYATIAAMIGQPVPSDKEVAEDSVNVLPAIVGTSSGKPLRISMIVHSPNGNYAIRKGDWKYIEGKASPTLKKVTQRDELRPQLYNLQEDPGEVNNVFDEHPDIAKQMADLLARQRISGRSR